MSPCHAHLTGICGAALYLSTLMLEKPRSMDDIGKILKISADTIKKRVDGQSVRQAGVPPRHEEDDLTEHPRDLSWHDRAEAGADGVCLCRVVCCPEFALTPTASLPREQILALKPQDFTNDTGQ
jgi:hypothetical protein